MFYTFDGGKMDMMQNYFGTEDFRRFVALDCDRKSFIQEFLNRYGIDCPVMQIAGKNHLYVKFPMSQYNSMFKIKTIIAHYDRVPHSPGANDNSAAVYTILNWIAWVSKNPVCHNMRVIFTDGEELGEGGVNQQGAFALAQVFNRLGITKDEIYVFDCMGRGDIPIICQNDLPKNLPAKLVKGLNSLETKAQEILKAATGGKWFMLPASYSDNASFITNGIPAIAITLLPSEEVESYVRTKMSPATWKMFHTMNDSIENLTSKSYEVFFKILNQLAAAKTLVDFS